MSFFPHSRVRCNVREGRVAGRTEGSDDTLFRYGGSLSDPEQFLVMVEIESADATSEVDELVVSK
jgi:hypothetical protein